MLNVELAERVIDKLSGCTEYNINIMNEKGIIVASKDKSRIGTFHEAAFEIIDKKLDYKTVEAEDTYLGTKPGINMAMEYKKKIIGVLGLTGEADNGELRAVAAVIKKMLETVLEYEEQKEAVIKRKTGKDRFINSLLYENASKSEIENMAQSLGYLDMARMTILISFKQKIILSEIMGKIHGGGVQTKEEMTLFSTI